MVLVRNWQFFHVFNLGKIDHENLFHDDGKRKHAFLGYKNKTFKNSKNWDFSKGVSLWFWPGDSRRTWQTINELTSRKSRKIAVTSLKVNGLSITNPTEISNEFNNYFATIGPELSRNIDSADGDVHRRYISSTDQCFQLRPTRVNKVFSLLNKLNKSKATGLDKISARLIRECADLICIPICDIFNQSISLGIFPDDWKCVRVTPLFKKGDRDDLNNYSPISVISFVAKAFERSVYDHLCLFRRTRHHL